MKLYVIQVDMLSSYKPWIEQNTCENTVIYDIHCRVLQSVSARCPQNKRAPEAAPVRRREGMYVHVP